MNKSYCVVYYSQRVDMFSTSSQTQVITSPFTSKPCSRIPRSFSLLLGQLAALVVRGMHRLAWNAILKDRHLQRSLDSTPLVRWIFRRSTEAETISDALCRAPGQGAHSRESAFWLRANSVHETFRFATCSCSYETPLISSRP
jgi:hypothetical protein